MATFMFRSFESVLSACKTMLKWSSFPRDVENEIKSLEDDLEWVEEVLADAKSATADADVRAARGERLAQQWLADAQRQAFRASDLLGVYEYEVVAQEVRNRERETQEASSSATALALLSKRKLKQVHNYHSPPLMEPKFREEFARSVSELRKDMYCVNYWYKEKFSMEDVELKKTTADSDLENYATSSMFCDDVIFIGRERIMLILFSLLLTDNIVKNDESAADNMVKNDESGADNMVKNDDSGADNMADNMVKNDESGVPVIALVGMGGVGKSTVAQHIYNDFHVCSHYSMRGWVYVSNDFKPQALIRATFEALTKGEIQNCEELSTLQRILADSVRNKKFLLVLDNVWNEDVQEWDKFYSSLRKGAKGSKIIVTTRSHEVAGKMRALRCIDVGVLSNEDSWTLFQTYAFRNYNETENESPQLFHIAKKIAEKSKGLPLAIKVIGCDLYAENDLEIWRYLLESNNFFEIFDRSEIHRRLALSYIPLPTELKRCFVISSVFPKDRAIRKHELLQLWMADDLVRNFNERKGMAYIEALLSRSLFFHPPDKCTVRLGAGPNDNVVINGANRYQYVMLHDIIHDLAQTLFTDEIIRIDKQEGMEVLIPHTCHHAFVDTIDDRSLRLQHDHNYNSSLRTLDSSRGALGHYKLALQSPEEITLDSVRKLTYYETEEEKRDGLLHGCFRKMRNLRHLDLYARDGIRPNFALKAICTLYNLRILNFKRHMLRDTTVSLPSSIGNLKHLIYMRMPDVENVPESICCLTKLRTLDLPAARVSYLPEDISELCNLEILMLNSSDIRELPESICRMTALRILSLRSCWALLNLPRDLANLTGLKTLVDKRQPRFSPSDLAMQRQSTIVDFSSSMPNPFQLEIEGFQEEHQEESKEELEEFQEVSKGSIEEKEKKRKRIENPMSRRNLRRSMRNLRKG